jgi:hypothetical protein
MKRRNGAALAVLAIVFALPALRGCGGETERTEATGADVATFVEVLVPLIANSNCANLSDAAREFQTNVDFDHLDFQKEAKAFQRFVDAAPAEIRDDFQTFADAYSKWAEAMKRVDELKDADLANPTPETLDNLDAATAEVDRHEMQQATHHIVAWLNKHCA